MPQSYKVRLQSSWNSAIV